MASSLPQFASPSSVRPSTQPLSLGCLERCSMTMLAGDAVAPTHGWLWRAVGLGPPPIFGANTTTHQLQAAAKLLITQQVLCFTTQGEMTAMNLPFLPDGGHPLRTQPVAARRRRRRSTAGLCRCTAATTAESMRCSWCSTGPTGLVAAAPRPASSSMRREAQRCSLTPIPSPRWLGAAWQPAGLQSRCKRPQPQQAVTLCC